MKSVVASEFTSVYIIIIVCCCNSHLPPWNWTLHVVWLCENCCRLSWSGSLILFMNFNWHFIPEMCFFRIMWVNVSLMLISSTDCHHRLCTGESVRSIVCCWVIYRPQLLQVLIGLFELPQDTTAVTDDIPLMDPDADNAGMLYTFRQ